MKEHQKNEYGEIVPVGIDLDATIIKGNPNWRNEPESLGEVIDGAREAISEIRKIKPVVIYTARPYLWDRQQAIERYLKQQEVPYDGIMLGKPLFSIYIGDEAIGFRGDWKETLKEASKLLCYR